MSRQETVKVTIKKDGSGIIGFDLNGFRGEGCDVIKDIEAALGNVVECEATEEAHIHEIPDPVFNELAR